jgi:hypothetical protein
MRQGSGAMGRRRRRPAARTDCARLQRLHRLHDPHRGIPPLSGRQAAYPNGQARAHDEPAWCDWVRVASGQPARRRRFFDAAPRWLFWSLPPGVDGRDGPSLFLCFSDVWPSASPVARRPARTREWTAGRMGRGTFGSLPSSKRPSLALPRDAGPLLLHLRLRLHLLLRQLLRRHRHLRWHRLARADASMLTDAVMAHAAY